MKRAEIENLASLARLKLTEAEIVNYGNELSSIVEYVSTVSKIVADESSVMPTVGKRFNIFRADEITNHPNQYTKDIMAEMPEVEGRFLSVKKILQTED